jgi:hypothetical protein
MINKRLSALLSILAIEALTFTPLAEASWLSDITGINIDIPNAHVTFGPPRPDRVVPMLQHLPQDATQFFLNPVGGTLATAIRQAKALARQDCQPVPAEIIKSLAAFLPSSLFQGVCWNVYGQRFSIDSVLLSDFNVGAVTLEDVVVFKDYNNASNPALWAHEMIHVQQYRSLGVETFAHLYTSGSANALEGEAYSFQDFVQSHLPAPSQQPYWAAVPGWDPRAQINTAQYRQAAQQFINPLTCTSKVNTGPTVKVYNACPIPVRVVGFMMVNIYTGQQVPTPCTTQLCYLAPNTYSEWPEPPGWQTGLGEIVW